MAGKGQAPASGKELQAQVAELARSLGLRVELEAKAARRLWGSKRYIAVVITDEKTGKRLGIECKYQGRGGTAEEKIPATILDIEHWPIPGIVVISGQGFSPNMQGYLAATGKVIWFEELEEWLRLYFGL